MSALTGAVLGATTSCGAILAVRSSPPMRPVRLVDRVAPYVGDTAAPSKLLTSTGKSEPPFPVLRRLLGPALGALVARLDRLVGGRASVRRRLGGLGDLTTVEDFRVEQIVWGAGGMVAAAVSLSGIGALRGEVNPVVVVGAALCGAALGVLGRDWMLSRALRQREEQMLAEFPVVADLLALAVVAGEAPAAALSRVARLTRGELARDLQSALGRARAGTPLTRALGELADRSTLEPFGRFIAGLVVAIERGTPLADVLRAQAADVRELAKRELLEAGGRKEVAMMLPIVFLILPVTVLFALYPGLLTLTSLTR